MACPNCLNMQEDGLCAVYSKVPPEGFAARCRYFAPDPDAPDEAASTGTGISAGLTTARERLCNTAPCPYLDADTPPGKYCISQVLVADDCLVFRHLLLEEDTPCPRYLTA